jgi:hypothetical protein
VLTEGHQWRTQDPVSASREEFREMLRLLPGRGERSDERSRAA